MLRVIDIMSRDVVLAPIETSIRDAARLMASEQVGSLIVTQNDVPVGIVTETDFTRQVVGGDTTPEESISMIMSAPLYHTSMDADLLEVANAMTTNRIKKIPVLDGQHVVGIITQTDLVRHLFRSVRTLQLAYSQGKISPKQYAERSQQLFHSLEPHIGAHVTKNWHMRCADCSHLFMNPEEGGRFGITTCPNCGSHNLRFSQTAAF